MERFRSGRSRKDYSYVALVVGGIAVAVGGAALFGMVAHIWTPFLPQRGAGTAPHDPVSRAQFAAQLAQSRLGELTQSTPQRSSPVSGEPPRPIQLAVETRPVETVEMLPETALVLDSLSPRESVVFTHPAEVVAERSPTLQVADAVGALTPPTPAKIVEARPLEKPKPFEFPPLGSRPIEARPTGTMLAGFVLAPPKVVEPVHVETRVVEAKPVVESRSLVKVGELKVRPAKPAPPAARPVALAAKRVEPKVVVRAESRAAAPKVVEAKLKPLHPAKPAATKVADAKAIQPMRQVAWKVAGTAKPLARPELKRVAETKPVEAKVEAKVDTKRAAEAKAAEMKLAETRRAAENLAAQAKLAETKHAAEMKAAEARLAETKMLAEIRAAENKLEEAQRAAEARAAEAKLAETKRAIERTKAEAQLAEARLADSKRATERASAVRAVETRLLDLKSSFLRGRCYDCGRVASIITRLQDRGARDWEVRVNFGTTYKTFVYPSDPGFEIGDSVRVYAGRLTRM